MAKLAVVYWSGAGSTKAMADLVADGAREAEADVSVYTPAELTPELTDEFGHIAFGYPFMGAEQLEGSEFKPMFDSVKEKPSSKRVALFGSYGWGDGKWMRAWDSNLRDASVPVIGTVIVNEAPGDEAAENYEDLGKVPANA